MSNTVLIIGESGSGKSSSIRSLDPQETFIINVLDKPLPFKGYKSKYKRLSSNGEEGNYYNTDSYPMIRKAIDTINKKRPDIKNIIIDDFQYLLANEYMRRATETGYAKFTELAKNAWQLINDLISTRDDLFCFVLSHSEVDQSGKSKIKTIGKLLDEKITLEGMFTLILHTVIDNSHYKFLTQNNGTTMAKSPMGMFKDTLIDNDLNIVKQAMIEYSNEDINQ